MSPNQQTVFDAIKDDPGISVAEIAGRTELDYGQIRRALTRLVKDDLVFSLGHSGGGYSSRYAIRRPA